MVSINLTLEQVATFKSNALQQRPYAQRVSFALAHKMGDMLLNGEDYWVVLDELDFLEGLRPTSSSVAATQFKHRPLHPLWHKHYSSARHIPRNIALRWSGKQGGNDLQQLIDHVVNECGEELEQRRKLLIHRIVHEGYISRARHGDVATTQEVSPGEPRGSGLTGEWIIYGKHEGLNYYLDLATHHEAKADRVDALYDKLLKGSKTEFPFLFP